MDAFQASRSLLVFAELDRNEHNGTVARAGLQSINDGLAVYLGPYRVQNFELSRDGRGCIITAGWDHNEMYPAFAFHDRAEVRWTVVPRPANR